MSEAINEALERLEELARRNDPSFDANASKADLRTVLSHLRQSKEREAVKDRALSEIASSYGPPCECCAQASSIARTALTHSPETDGGAS